MRTVKNHYMGMMALLLCCIPASAQVRDNAKADFEKRVLLYSETRGGIDRDIPAIPKEATAEQIGIRKAALAKRVKEARANAKQGDIFTPEAAAMIRKIISAEFPDTQLAELRKAVVEAENKGVPVKVNAEYPEAKERLEMPPRLLLALPQLPDEVQYRFVGKHLLLVDKESGLILDFMTNAIP